MTFIMKKRKYKFSVTLNVEELSSVPVLNSVLFVKCRLLEGGTFADVTDRYVFYLFVLYIAYYYCFPYRLLFFLFLCHFYCDITTSITKKNNADKRLMTIASNGTNDSHSRARRLQIHRQAYWIHVHYVYPFARFVIVVVW